MKRGKYSLLPTAILVLLAVFAFSGSASAQVCGNTVVEPPETCDDGNTVDDLNGCDAACARNDVCGDSAIQDLFETCDDGNTVDDLNGCDAACARNDVCGDSAIQDLFEACDDGGESATCDADCTAVVCGDDYRNATAGETCEADDPAHPTCSDFGASGGTVSCADGAGNLDCTVAPVPNCYTCGNATLEAGEKCDGTTFAVGDSCLSVGHTGGTLSCSVDCLLLDDATCTGPVGPAAVPALSTRSTIGLVALLLGISTLLILRNRLS